MKRYLCDSCNGEINYDPTIVYGHLPGQTNKKAELCAICAKARLEGINWQTIKPRPVSGGI